MKEALKSFRLSKQLFDSVKKTAKKKKKSFSAFVVEALECFVNKEENESEAGNE